MPMGRANRPVVLLLGAIAALGSMATQMLVPVLPQVATALSISVAETQLIIGVFLIGLGAGQLVFGPLADRMSHRRLLMLGLALYIMGNALGAWSPNLAVLLTARLLQAVGAAAALVTARVLVNDMVAPEKAAAAQAQLIAIILISPTLAPVIGGWVALMSGWRGIMVVLGVAAALSAVLAGRLIQPQGHGAPRPPAPNIGTSYARVLGNGAFRAAAAALALTSTGLYVFLGATPFILHDFYGLDARGIGLCLMLVAAASIIGTRMVGAVTARGDGVVVGTAVAVLAMALLWALASVGADGLGAFLLPLTLLGLGAGLTGPSAMACALACEKGLSGTASSMAGALQMGASALGGLLLAPLAAGSVTHLAAAIGALSLTALLMTFWQKRGEPTTM